MKTGAVLLLQSARLQAEMKNNFSDFHIFRFFYTSLY